VAVGAGAVGAGAVAAGTGAGDVGAVGAGAVAAGTGAGDLAADPDTPDSSFTAMLDTTRRATQGRLAGGNDFAGVVFARSVAENSSFAGVQGASVAADVAEGQGEVGDIAVEGAGRLAGAAFLAAGRLCWSTLAMI
jgi:hypothetical protein